MSAAKTRSDLSGGTITQVDLPFLEIPSSCSFCPPRVWLAGTQALIFVVDAADRERVDEARQELHRIINDREMRDAIILLFANKQVLLSSLSLSRELILAGPGRRDETP